MRSEFSTSARCYFEGLAKSASCLLAGIFREKWLESRVVSGVLCDGKNKNARTGRAFLFGGLGRNRTTDTRIFSPLLYRLSYQAELG